ncbi:hypothetical protein HanRHA438_Chr13g0603471 [Helianthus annuus]|nr:hypothetical protein HanRHA438_Chr13g0603471 [Helianthus annuus]
MAIDAVVSESAHVSVENVKKESSANGHVGENESGPHVTTRCRSHRVNEENNVILNQDSLVQDWPIKHKTINRCIHSTRITPRLRFKDIMYICVCVGPWGGKSEIALILTLFY